MNPLRQISVSEIIRSDPRALTIFKKYKLNPEAYSKIKLSDIPAARRSDLSQVIMEIASLPKYEKEIHVPFSAMTVNQIIDHIIVNYHYFLKYSMFIIIGNLENDFCQSGKKYPL